MPERAVIWDLDGVIADTASVHLWSWQEAFGEVGVTYTEAEFAGTFGRRNPEIIRVMLGPNVRAEVAEAIAARKEELFRSAAAARVQAFPGVRELLVALKERGWAQALASSAPVENVELLLTTLGVRALLDAVVTERDVSVGKPAPDVFLVAASRLGVPPACCVVIEDAVAGVAAAKAAGMRCVAVTNTHSAAHLSQADRVVESLTEVGPDDLARLLGEGA